MLKYSESTTHNLLARVKLFPDNGNGGTHSIIVHTFFLRVDHTISCTGTLQTEIKSQEIYDQLHCTGFRNNATGIMHCTVVEQGQLVYNKTDIRSC